MYKPNDRCTNFEVRAKGDGVLNLIKLNCDICSIDKLTCGVYAACNKAKTYAVSFKFDDAIKEVTDSRDVNKEKNDDI